MSGGATAFAEGRVIDFVLGTAPAAGTGVSYVSLHTGSVAISGNEVTGGSYARQLFSYTKSGSEPTLASNPSSINFPTATASWGLVQSYALWDAVSGGNMLMVGGLAASKNVGSGDTARFSSGQLGVIVD